MWFFFFSNGENNSFEKLNNDYKNLKEKSKFTTDLLNYVKDLNQRMTLFFFSLNQGYFQHNFFSFFVSVAFFVWKKKVTHTKKKNEKKNNKTKTNLFLCVFCCLRRKIHFEFNLSWVFLFLFFWEAFFQLLVVDGWSLKKSWSLIADRTRVRDRWSLIDLFFSWSLIADRTRLHDRRSLIVIEIDGKIDGHTTAFLVNSSPKILRREKLDPSFG